MPFHACTVSFVHKGQKHEARVDAETAYEAAALALKQWASSRYIKGPSRQVVLEVQVDAPRRFQVRVADLLHWLYETQGRTPDEQERKKKLRALLAGDGR